MQAVSPWWQPNVMPPTDGRFGPFRWLGMANDTQPVTPSSRFAITMAGLCRLVCEILTMQVFRPQERFGHLW